jgi:hypothetical protein
MLAGMEPALVQSLQDRRPQIRGRWLELLRAAPATSPLANPDLLDHLLDPTMEEVLGALREPPARAAVARARVFDTIRSACECGRNPLLEFFVAGEQALIEALVVAQAGGPAPDFATRNIAVAELYLAVRAIAQTQVDAFCSLCQHRPPGPPASPPGPATSR